MEDTLDSPSSLFGEGEYTTDEDVWSPSLRRDVFWHSNPTTREPPSPRPDIPPSYLTHPSTITATLQQSFNDRPPPPNQASNTFSPSDPPPRTLSLVRDPSHPTSNTQNESGSSPESIEREPPSPSISFISWNVLSSDSESGNPRMNDSDLRQERWPTSSAQHPNTSQRTSSDFVDLTEEIDTPLRTRMPSASTQRGSNKRRRVEPKTTVSSPQTSQRRKTESQNTVLPAVEEVDLRNVDDDKGLSKVLEDQRMATIKAQQEQAARPVKLATLSCVICMELMTDVTATFCGMLPTFDFSLFL